MQAAKAFVQSALNYSKDIVIGNGPQGPFDHLFRHKSQNDNAGQKPQFDANDLFLYAVTDSGMNKKWGRLITDAVKASIEGGATIIQLRFVKFHLSSIFLNMIIFKRCPQQCLVSKRSMCLSLCLVLCHLVVSLSLAIQTAIVLVNNAEILHS